MGAAAKKRAGDVPRFISIRELARQTSTVLEALRAQGRHAVITDRGRPVGLLYGIDPDEFEDYVLERAPEFVEARGVAIEEFREGRARRLSDVMADIDRDEG